MAYAKGLLDQRIKPYRTSDDSERESEEQRHDAGQSEGNRGPRHCSKCEEEGRGRKEGEEGRTIGPAMKTRLFE